MSSLTIAYSCSCTHRSQFVSSAKKSFFLLLSLCRLTNAQMASVRVQPERMKLHTKRAILKGKIRTLAE